MEGLSKEILAHDYDNNLDERHHLLVAKSQYISKLFDLYSEGKIKFENFKKELDSYLSQKQ